MTVLLIVLIALLVVGAIIGAICFFFFRKPVAKKTTDTDTTSRAAGRGSSFRSASFRTSSFTAASLALATLWKEASPQAKRSIAERFASLREVEEDADATMPGGQVQPSPDVEMPLPLHDSDAPAAAPAPSGSDSHNSSRRASIASVRLSKALSDRASLKLAEWEGQHVGNNTSAPESRRCSVASVADADFDVNGDAWRPRSASELKRAKTDSNLIEEVEGPRSPRWSLHAPDDFERYNSVLRLQQTAGDFLAELEAAHTELPPLDLDSRRTSFALLDGLTPTTSLIPGRARSISMHTRSRAVSMRNSPADESPDEKEARRQSVRSAQSWLQRQVQQMEGEDDDERDDELGPMPTPRQVERSPMPTPRQPEPRPMPTLRQLEPKPVPRPANDLPSPERVSGRPTSKSVGTFQPKLSRIESAGCLPPESSESALPQRLAAAMPPAPDVETCPADHQSLKAEAVRPRNAVRRRSGELWQRATMLITTTRNFQWARRDPSPPDKFPLPKKFFFSNSNDRSSYSQQVVPDRASSASTDTPGASPCGSRRSSEVTF